METMTLEERATYIIGRLEMVEGYGAMIREACEAAQNETDPDEVKAAEALYAKARKDMKRWMRELGKVL